MKDITLLVMAAGMGSRYGGLKQIDPVGPSGEVILEYSVYDAVRAGFNKVVFLIKEEMQDAFEDKISKHLRDKVKIEYAFQSVDMIPDGFCVPEGRIKPWGTAHAVLCAKDKLDGPFAAINADDYYGIESFKKMYDFLSEEDMNSTQKKIALVGYRLKNTVSENGSVARGVCKVDENSNLLRVDERTNILKQADGSIVDKTDENEKIMDPNTLVSMNFWGFYSSFTADIERIFPSFLEDALKNNPIKSELYLPTVVTDLLNKNEVTVEVIESSEKWFGVTYKEDKDFVCRSIEKLHNSGKYPASLR